MAGYSIYFKDSVRKDLDSIPKNDLQRIIERIGNLAEDPRPAGCEKLSGQEKYRVRQGNYCIVYSIQDTELTVWVVKVGHRRDVYRI
jgi:mRNA interferase RelE/StbE